jgi:dTMP kinase
MTRPSPGEGFVVVDSVMACQRSADGASTTFVSQERTFVVFHPAPLAVRARRRTLLGVLISVEGIDGAGKTTLVKALAQELDASVLREPGGVELSERIRSLVQDPSLDIDPRAEALLFAAARAQLVAEKLRDTDELVILDRFIDSSLAYQGGGRELGVADIQALNDFGTHGLRPDRTLYLKIDPQRALARLDDHDRLEAAGVEFFTRVADAYDALAAAEPDRFVILDATQPPDAVLAAALKALR